jgi:hypothetical protein
MTYAAHSLAAWLESQERMMRAWVSEAALDPYADHGLLMRLETHCRWLAEERESLSRELFADAPERSLR